MKSIVSPCNSFFLKLYNEHEMLELFKGKLKNRFSSEFDEKTFLIKRAFVALLNPLVFLVILSFTAGSFPGILNTNNFQKKTVAKK